VWIAAALLGLGGVAAQACQVCEDQWNLINYCTTVGICEIWCADICTGDIIPGGKDGFIAVMHPINQAITDTVNSMTSELSDASTLADRIHAAVNDGFATLGKAIDDLESWSAVMTSASDANYSLKRPLVDLTAQLTDGFADVGTLVSGVDASVSAVVDALGGITAEGGLWNELTSLVRDAQEGVVTAFDSASRLFDTHAAFLKSVMNRTFSDLHSHEAEMLGNVEDHVAGLLASVSDLRGMITGELSALLSEDFGALRARLSGLGERLDQIVVRLGRLAAALQTLAANPDQVLEGLSQANDMLPRLPGLLSAAADFMQRLADEEAGSGARVLAECITSLPEIVGKLPAVAAAAGGLPALWAEVETKLIQDTPQIMEGFPALISGRIDELFLNLSEDASTLLSLVPKLDQVAGAVALGESTQADIQQGLAALDTSIQAGFTALAARLETLSAGAGQPVPPEAEIAQLERQLAEAEAEHTALLEQQRDLRQLAFHGDPMKALLWLVECDTIKIREGVVASTDSTVTMAVAE
jgi:hypothetical protein